MDRIIAFRNKAQLALWKYELLGQLSDGHWENSRPFNHWQDWHQAKALVDPSNVGRNFYPIRERYNFANKDLLEVVDGRMIGYVRLVLQLGEGIIERANLRWAVGCDGKLERSSRDKMGAEDAGIVVRALENEVYTLKDLKRDLRDMGKIIKTWRSGI